MKKKILISFFWFLIAIMLVSALGQNQVFASDDAPEYEEVDFNSEVSPRPELAPGVIEQDAILVDEIPELAVGDKRVVISGWNLMPWRKTENTLFWTHGWGCLGVHKEEGAQGFFKTAQFPFYLPIGSKIKNIYWTGVDWIGSQQNAEMEFWIERLHWRGNKKEAIVYDHTGPAFSSGEPFNRYKAVNHIVQYEWAYQIRVDIWSTSTVKSMHVCQITIDYAEPSPFHSTAITHEDY
jgi:hypothetical protein